MTREEILNMEPGWKMDALVTEKVMGWEWIEPVCDSNCLQTPYAFSLETGESYDFRPSTDISTAWEVEEQIKTLKLHVEYCQALRQVVMSSGEYVGLFDYVHATPAQRCKAALLAVIEKEDEA